MLQRLNDANLNSEKRAVLTSDSTNETILKGVRYDIETVVAVSNGDAVNFVFDPTALSSSKRVTRFPSSWSTSTGSVIVTIGTCTSYTGGTAYTPINRNYYFLTSKPAQTVITYDATLTGYATSQNKVLVGTEGTRQSAGGGSGATGNRIILDPTKIYVFSISAADSDLNLSVYLDWMETLKNDELGF